MPIGLPPRSIDSLRSSSHITLRHYRVTLEDVLEAHRVALLRSGGLDGVRDLGLIESVIARPYSGYHTSIHRKAAALTHSLAKNHGFLDGNKRTALLTLVLFIDRSNYDLVGPDNRLVGAIVSEEQSVIITSVEIEPMILAVVDDRLSHKELVRWFRARLRCRN